MACKWALVFPGQGSQYPGMGKGLVENFPPARKAMEQASEGAGMDLISISTSSDADKLARTELAQPCIYAVSLAAWAALKARVPEPPCLAAGHSLGEYTALTAAGAFSVDQGARAVMKRGEWMEQAAGEARTGMAAVLNASWEEAEAVCREAAQGMVLAPANDNCPGQVVISGEWPALERALELFKARGKKSRKLKVSGAFHTSLMKPAADKMRKLLAQMELNPPRIPVLSNLDAQEYRGPEEIPDRLSRQMTNPVRWRELLLESWARGARVFVEAGPGTVLAGLVKRTLPDAIAVSVSEPEHVEIAVKAIMDHGRA